MANGYSNSRRGGARWRSSNPGLDTLEQILGITGNIANRVQDTRDRRNDSQLSYLNSLTKGFENNYSLKSINVMKEQLNDYKAKNINNMSADALDFFNITETRIKEHSENLEEYDTQVGAIDALPDKAITLIQDLSTYSNLGEEAKNAYKNENWKNKDGTVGTIIDKENDLSDIMVEYANNMETFFSKHGNRIQKQNPYLANKYLNLETILSQAVSAFDDFNISENEKNYLVNNLINPNSQAIKEWSNARKQAKDYVIGSKQNNFTNAKAAYDKLNQMSVNGFYVEPGEKGGEIASDSDSMGDVFYIGKGKQTAKDRMADIRNYYSGELGGNLKGDNLDIQVQSSMDAYASLEAQKAQQYSILKNNSKFGGVDFMQEFNVKEYEPSTIAVNKFDSKKSNKDGIPMIYMPDHPQANSIGYVPENLIIGEKQKKDLKEQNITKEVQGRAKQIKKLRKDKDVYRRMGRSTVNIQKQLDVENKKLRDLGFDVNLFGDLVDHKKIKKDVAESVHRMQFPPTPKMMGDRYISGEPVTPEEEVLMGQKWKKQRPRD